MGSAWAGLGGGGGNSSSGGAVSLGAASTHPPAQPPPPPPPPGQRNGKPQSRRDAASRSSRHPAVHTEAALSQQLQSSQPLEGEDPSAAAALPPLAQVSRVHARVCHLLRPHVHTHTHTHTRSHTLRSFSWTTPRSPLLSWPPTTRTAAAVGATSTPCSSTPSLTSPTSRRRQQRLLRPQLGVGPSALQRTRSTTTQRRRATTRTKRGMNSSLLPTTHSSVPSLRHPLLAAEGGGRQEQPLAEAATSARQRLSAPPPLL